jgi:hypothetical protein
VIPKNGSHFSDKVTRPLSLWSMILSQKQFPFLRIMRRPILASPAGEDRRLYYSTEEIGDEPGGQRAAQALKG